MLQNIRIVMVQTTHPGNIGAAARAMKNMFLSRLTLVAPLHFPSEQASVRASGADEILANAQVVDALADAVADCRIVVGASARLRSVTWPQLTPREVAALAHSESESAPVALVFGRESSGLSNDELDLCTHLMHIPTDPQFSSLNVAMAIQVAAYELMLAAADAADAADSVDRGRPTCSPASTAQMEGFFVHLGQALEDIGFADGRRSEKLMRRLRRLFHRASPDADELNILRGILSAAQGRKSMRRV
ncbi:MAG: RNA methyltransferase [Chromatiaceae bacterium]|nr:RNA methyltransferase [Gammaproteobacteria bacterium]MCP5301171.1 RNA methyltransferase [Chromatiaceae bacterium]MCP5421357.1 RNA methyltransferase [Chromatiaceae bacterium]